MSQIAKYESMIHRTQLAHAQFAGYKTKFVQQFGVISASLRLVPILLFPYSHKANFYWCSPEGGGGGTFYDRSWPLPNTKSLIFGSLKKYFQPLFDDVTEWMVYNNLR